MAPPQYNDLGKSCKDLFNKGYSKLAGQMIDNFIVFVQSFSMKMHASNRFHLFHFLNLSLSLSLMFRKILKSSANFDSVGSLSFSVSLNSTR